MDQPPEGCQNSTPFGEAPRLYGAVVPAKHHLLSIPGFGYREQRAAKRMRSIVVFDLGGVLIDWDPRHLYRKLFAGNETAMEQFLATVCTHEWNRCQDAGRSFAEGARLLKAEHPDKAELIDAYGARFDEMMAGPVAGAVEILAELRERGTPLYGLTNFSAETYPYAVARFDFLGWFRGILVSGEVGAIKPDPRIYELLLERFAIDPHRAVYIDDVAANAEAARPFGIHGIHFSTPDALREELVRLALL
jgi:2-haloacid dehalogenase